MKASHRKRRLNSWCMRRAISSYNLKDYVRRFKNLPTRMKKLIHYRDYWK